MKSTAAFLTVIALILIPAFAEPLLVGIGIALRNDKGDKKIHIASVLPDSPALNAGMFEGMIVNKVNGIALTGKKIEECVKLIRGPAGTTVRFEMVDPVTNETTQVDVVRKILGVVR